MHANTSCRLWEAFEGGTVRARELRLSRGEAAALRKECAHAVLTPISGETDGKIWSHVILEGER